VERSDRSYLPFCVRVAPARERVSGARGTRSGTADLVRHVDRALNRAGFISAGDMDGAARVREPSGAVGDREPNIPIKTVGSEGSAGMIAPSISVPLTDPFSASNSKVPATNIAPSKRKQRCNANVLAPRTGKAPVAHLPNGIESDGHIAGAPASVSVVQVPATVYVVVVGTVVDDDVGGGVPSGRRTCTERTAGVVQSSPAANAVR
jgi:hypothetical protein